MELHNSTEDIIYWLLWLVFCGFQKNSAECKYSKSHWSPFSLREKKTHPKPQNPQKPKTPKTQTGPHKALLGVELFIHSTALYKPWQTCQQQAVLISERFHWRVRLGQTQTISQRKERVTDEVLLRLQDLRFFLSVFSLFLPFPAQLWPTALRLDYSRNYKHHQHNKV